ncbi:TonB-dependent siderophore receptor [Oleiharenicola lentus]|uniref:TonB-dependent siderophore receptor n=1 Tax=Oleiharenicola lentus TaxID=2508720 RepID=UPI003F671581
MKHVKNSPRARGRRWLTTGLIGLLAASTVVGQPTDAEVIRALREEVAALRSQLAVKPASTPATAPAAPVAPAPTPSFEPAPTVATTSTPADNETLMLSAFEVKGDRDYGYLKTNAATATRIGMEIQKVPMNISVLSQEFLTDTNARSLTDLFRYSAASSGDNRFAMRVPANEATPQGGFTMRGFTVNTIMRNGVFRYISHNVDNVERIEVVKGPAAVFFGQGYPGGVINFVTKRPSFTEIPTTVTYATGEGNIQRVNIDTNNVLGEKAAIRVVGGWEDSGGERSREFTKNVNITPSIAFIPFTSGKVKIVAEAEFSEKKFARNDYEWIFSDFAGWKNAAATGQYGSATTRLSTTIAANAANGLAANVVQNTTTPTLAYATYINNKRIATGDLYLPAHTSVERGAYYTDASGNFIHDEGFNWTSPGAYIDEKNNTFSVTADITPVSWADVRYSYTHDEAKHLNTGGGPVMTPYADGVHYNIALGAPAGYNRFTDTHTTDIVFKKDNFLGGNHKLLTGISYANWEQQYTAAAAASDYNWSFLPGARNTVSNPDYAGLNVAKYNAGAVPVNQVLYDRTGAIIPVRQLYSNYDPGHSVLAPEIGTYWKNIQRNTIDIYNPKLFGNYINYQGSFFSDRLNVLGGFREEKRWERGQFAINNAPWFVYTEDMITNPDAYPEDVWGQSKAYQKTNVLTTKGNSWMGGASFALTDSLSVYASVSKIFKFNSGTVGGFASGDELLYAQGLIAQYQSIGQAGFNYKGTTVTSVQQFADILTAQNYYKTIPNEDGMNYEVGLKYSDPAGKFVGTFSIFTANRRNQKTDDTIATLNINEPLNSSSDANIIAGINRALLLGATSPTSFSATSSGRVFRIRNYDNEVRISGTEIEFIWTPIRNFQAIINGSWLPQAEVVQDGRPVYAEPGTAAYNLLTATQKRDADILWKSRIVNVPEYRANAFGKYTFSNNFIGEYGRGLALSLGGRYSSETVIAQNVDWNPLNGGYQAGNYVVYDFTVGLPFEVFGYQLRTTLGLYNLTDKQYSEGSFVLSPGRNWTLSTTMTF